MDVRCPHCQNVVRIDLAAISPLGSDLPCSHCAGIFRVQPPPPNPTSAPAAQPMDHPALATNPALASTSAVSAPPIPSIAPPKPPPTAQAGLALLFADGSAAQAADMAELQRWIVERRVPKDAQIKLPGANFVPVTHLVELKPFFDVLETTQAPPPKQIDTSLPEAHSPSPMHVDHNPKNSIGDSQGGFQNEPNDDFDDDLDWKPKRPIWPWLVLLFLITAGLIGFGVKTGRIELSSMPAKPVTPGSNPALEPPSQEPKLEVIPKQDEALPKQGSIEPAPAPSKLLPKKKPKASALSLEALLSQAQRLLERDQASRALPIYEKASEQYPNDAKSWAGMGWCYADLERYPAATAAFEQALRRNKNLGEAHFGLGETFRAMKRIQKAKRHYRAALKNLPAGPEADIARRMLQRIGATP